MQKWEYKTITRYRGFQQEKRNDLYMTALPWNIDIEGKLPEMGEEGWELVAIESTSRYLGGTTISEYHLITGTGKGQIQSDDYAGFTSNQTWIFKRLKA